MKWVKRIIGFVLVWQALGFLPRVLMSLNLSLDGYQDSLGKAIFMAVIGVGMFIAGFFLFKSTLSYEEPDLLDNASEVQPR
jgi:hypothetical protein